MQRGGERQQEHQQLLRLNTQKKKKNPTFDKEARDHMMPPPRSPYPKLVRNRCCSICMVHTCAPGVGRGEWGVVGIKGPSPSPAIAGTATLPPSLDRPTDRPTQNRTPIDPAMANRSSVFLVAAAAVASSRNYAIFIYFKKLLCVLGWGTFFAASLSLRI